jgi:ribonuclease BN (tRNA processing enzyme)
MRLTIWGCRGSVPTPGPDTFRYGGNTSCVEVSVDDGTILVLDAGTGIRRLGFDLLDRGARRVHLLLTHLHLDHLEGLRFFAPLWDEQVTLDIWGPPSPLLSLRERISRSFSPPLFPIDLREVPAQVTFHDVPRQPWTVDGARLLADLVAHPGPTVGFRIETVTSSFAYLPDHEPALAGTIADRSRDWISGGAIADDVDILLHDAQYFEDEYEERIGWGHSSVSRRPSAPAAWSSSTTNRATPTSRWSASKRARGPLSAGTKIGRRLRARAWSSSCPESLQRFEVRLR